MKYLIDWIQVGSTATGKSKADVTLKDINEVKTDVTIWGDFPNFANLMPGMEIEGILVPAKDPKYKPSFSAPRKTTAPSNFKQKMAEDLMIKKDASISKHQDSKEYSIKVSSTFRAAVDSAIAEYQEARRISLSTDVKLDSLFEKWREFYWMHFDVVEDKDYPPTGIKGL